MKKSRRSNLTCPRCGKSNVETTLFDQDFTFGEDEAAVQLSATVPARECRDCGFEFLDEAGEAARHNAVCAHLDALTADA